MSGTGILPLMDFVAYIARKVLIGGNFSSEIRKPILNSTEISSNGGEFEPFRFILYTSFVDKAESIGLELCESLHKYCEERELPTFQLIQRFSKNDDPT